MGTPAAAALATSECSSQPGFRSNRSRPRPVVQLRRRGGRVARLPREEVAQVGVGLEQDLRRKQDVVDPDDPVFVQLDVIEERRAAVQREVQGMVEIVVQVGAGADDKVHQAPVHHLDDAAAEPGRRQRTGHGQPDRRVVCRIEHPIGEDVTRLGQPPGVEGLECLVDEPAQLLAAARPVVADRLAAEIGPLVGGWERLAGDGARR